VQSASELIETDVLHHSSLDTHLYNAPDPNNTWKCLRSGRVIPASAINDDYCDCDDGSDEPGKYKIGGNQIDVISSDFALSFHSVTPGTSACANSTFYCHNKGHIPAYILSSRVNDGICGTSDEGSTQ
jgi:protein kinase C substrate 80K-H